MLKCHVILSFIISSNRKHTRCSTISHDYSITWSQFDQSDSLKLVRFNKWRSSIVIWFGLSWYSIRVYTVRSVHFRMLLISHKYIFSFSKLIIGNVSGHDTLIGDESVMGFDLATKQSTWSTESATIRLASILEYFYDFSQNRINGCTNRFTATIRSCIWLEALRTLDY